MRICIEAIIPKNIQPDDQISWYTLHLDQCRIEAMIARTVSKIPSTVGFDGIRCICLQCRLEAVTQKHISRYLRSSDVMVYAAFGCSVSLKLIWKNISTIQSKLTLDGIRCIWLQCRIGAMIERNISKLPSKSGFDGIRHTW